MLTHGNEHLSTLGEHLSAGHRARLSLVDCVALLDAMHAELRAEYEPNALGWVFDTLPDLVQQLHDTEARIDALAKTTGGPTEADFREALAVRATVWRAMVARYRAHREQHGELPDDAALAVGVSYGDGQPGTWDVVRRGQ